MPKSIEEQIEDIVKKQLDDISVQYFTKTASINTEIDEALFKAKSKSGGSGGNYPDVRAFITLPNMARIPVIIEVKGTKGDLVKLNSFGNIENVDERGEALYKNIKKYAVNGALHYAEAIINYTKSFKNVIAIGVNGYKEGDVPKTEFLVYYVSRDYSMIPKKLGDWSDLSFLGKRHLRTLQDKIVSLSITAEEKEQKSRELENRIETILKNLNQKMHEALNIEATERVQFVCGMIMAALGVENHLDPLKIEELKGQLGENSNDGALLISKIKDFLNHKNLPPEKKFVINAQFTKIYTNVNYYTPKNGESPIKTVYISIHDEIVPIFNSANHIDFTGRLFNVLNSWISVRPGDDKNDVVLTPRYVCELMAHLCKVNKDSYVWDYAAGSGGFLISAMKQMIEDANHSIMSEDGKREKIINIKLNQLLGIEIRPDIYILAVLNMILMGDGSSHILNKDSLKEYNGKYEQGNNHEEDFPANVFLLNPPYSAAGKGFVFVEKALEKMNSGRAAVLIQENAGSGNGLPYTAEILKNNTLVASIHMSDIFCGKAGVQTAIYVFEVGHAHREEAIVKFIDFSNDGYTRQNRKKSSLSVNLKNTDHALERYQEVADIVLGNKKKTDYLADCVIEDTISLNGKDWTYGQHKKVDTVPTEADFRKTVADYLAWKVSTMIKRESFTTQLKTERIDQLSATCLNGCTLTTAEKDALEKLRLGNVSLKRFRIGELFDIHPTRAYKMTNRKLFLAKGSVPVVTNSSVNNGIAEYVNLKPTETGNKITFSDTTTADAIFYQPVSFVGYPHIQGLYAKNVNAWSEKSYLYFLSVFRFVASGRFDYATKFTRAIAINMKCPLPVTVSGKIDYTFMENLITAQEKLAISNVVAER